MASLRNRVEMRLEGPERHNGSGIRRRSYANGAVLPMVGALLFGLFGTALAASSAGGSKALRTKSAGASHVKHKTTPPKFSAKNPRHGGSLTVLELAGIAGTWQGINPSTDVDAGGNAPYMDSVFGELFELGSGGKTLPDLATGYKFTNGGKTILVTLRKGVKFSDGTPFDASAVAYNWRKDLKASCSCKPIFNQKAAPVIKVVNPRSVSITLQYVDASFIHDLQDDIFNWIYSPSANKKMKPQAFALKPVGAGPFVVVSDTPSSALVLKRNPRYWQKGLPYLDKLTFESVANDESALEDMQAGSGQAYQNLQTQQLVSSFKKHFRVTLQVPVTMRALHMNTTIPPFNNIKARQAIYYATNSALLDKKLIGGLAPPEESFLTPASPFYGGHKVPGYRGYNLAKAKAIVKSLGGISFDLMMAGANTSFVNNAEALQAMFQAAGMKVKLDGEDLSGLLAKFSSDKWQTELGSVASFDPATGTGVNAYYASSGALSGVHDKHLDALLQAASTTTNNAARKKLYFKVSKYIAKKAYSPFLFPSLDWNAAAKAVGAPGLTTALPSSGPYPDVLWQYAYNNK